MRLGTTVDRVTKTGDRYLVQSGERRFRAERVVVATGHYGKPTIPEFASELDPRIVQMHSSEYRNQSQLRPGGVLLVGAGNSGADIAMDVARRHDTWLSGPDKGQVPLRIEHPLRRVVVPILWFVASHVLTTKTPLGRKARPHVLAEGAPRIRVKSADLKADAFESKAKHQEMRTLPPRSKNFPSGTSFSVDWGPATPMMTQVPARSRLKMACMVVSGRPTASNE